MRPDDLVIHSPLDRAMIAGLEAEASAEGFGMLGKLLDEWHVGRNGLDQPGEKSYLAERDGITCGVCGLNIDPFGGDKTIGPVRRLYVSPSLRRQGIATALVHRVLEDARGHFRVLHLRTRNPVAAAFYESIGFTPTSNVEFCTHTIHVRD